MRHRFTSLVVAGLLALLALPAVAAAADCELTPGFATLKTLIDAAEGSDTVGACVEKAHVNLENGDTLQQTTGGLLVLRQADHRAAFTDGHHTWIDGPDGLHVRLNTQHFAWESSLPVQTGTVAYDTDADGLIEIANLEQLDAIRWDLNGDGAPDDRANAAAYAAAFPSALGGMGCPDSGCTGYELTRNLGFGDAGSYASGAVNPMWTQDSGWTPIGSPSNPFEGTLDGGGHTIANLFIYRPGNDYVGLFGEISGAVRQLNVLDIQIRGAIDIGTLAGLNSGAISHVRATGFAQGVTRIGGLVGENRGVISDSHAASDAMAFSGVVGGLTSANYGAINTSHATGNVSTNARLAGGLAAINRGEISESYAQGNVSASAILGGLVAINQSSIEKSYATGAVSSPNDDAGGLVGANDRSGRISASYATGTVSANHRVGGLVGVNRHGGVVSDSYATGVVTGRIGSGGLTGWNDGAISASYATGDLSGEDDTGGLVGRNSGTISASYATGTVSANRRVGGLVGYNDLIRGLNDDNDHVGAITASYATGDISGEDDTGGLVGENQGTITGSHAAGDVTGLRDTGGLVGENFGDEHSLGTITASYATGRVSAGIANGGLVGWNSGPITFSFATNSVAGDDDSGGLVGRNRGPIRASYATGTVTADNRAGGLVGVNETGAAIRTSYATGAVSGDDDIGGLVGENQSIITASYATGAVTGNRDTGGLVGENLADADTISATYWDIETTGQSQAAGFGSVSGAQGLSTAALQASTGYTGVYATWNQDGDLWDFGTSAQYPQLKADFDGDGTATAQEFGTQ